MSDYIVSSIQEALVLGTVESTVDFIPVFYLLRQRLRVYLNMSACKFPFRHFEKIQDIKNLLQVQANAVLVSNRRKLDVFKEYISNENSLFCWEWDPRNR